MSKIYVVRYIETLKSNITQTVDKVYGDFPQLVEYPELNHNKENILRLLTEKHMLGLMMYQDTKLMAYIIGETTVLPDGRHVYFITYLYVDVEHRNIGLGKYMLNSMIKYIMRIGIYVLVLMSDETDMKAQNFYEKFGFEVDSYLVSRQRVGKYVPLSKYLYYV